MFLSPQNSLRVDCYVDADFAGLFAASDRQDQVGVKSRTGYVIMYKGAPLLWGSRLQTQIALSTMEAEYIALSQAMRDLIPIREVLKEIMSIVFKLSKTISYCLNRFTMKLTTLLSITFLHRQCLKIMMHAYSSLECLD